MHSFLVLVLQGLRKPPYKHGRRSLQRTTTENMQGGLYREQQKQISTSNLENIVKKYYNCVHRCSHQIEPSNNLLSDQFYKCVSLSLSSICCFSVSLSCSTSSPPALFIQSDACSSSSSRAAGFMATREEIGSVSAFACIWIL